MKGGPANDLCEAIPGGAAAAPWEAELERALDLAQGEALSATGGTDNLVLPLGEAGELVLRGATIDGVGVRAGSLRWSPAAPPMAPLRERADSLARYLAAPLGGPLTPIEVDAQLGQATLRTPLPALRRGRFWHIELEPDGSVAIERYRVVAGERQRESMTLTREQLRDTVEGLLDA